MVINHISENKCADDLLLSGTWELYDDDDDDTSVLRSVSSSMCQCATCQQRSRGMWTVRSQSIVMLPSDDAGWSAYLQTRVDRDSLQYLNEKHVINWCSGTYNLYPIKTAGIIVIFIHILHINDGSPSPLPVGKSWIHRCDLVSWMFKFNLCNACDV